MLDGETDFMNLPQWYVTRIARLLSEMPQQTFGMYTPKEKFKELCAESCWLPKYEYKSIRNTGAIVGK